MERELTPRVPASGEGARRERETEHQEPAPHFERAPRPGEAARVRGGVGEQSGHSLLQARDPHEEELLPAERGGHRGECGDESGPQSEPREGREDLPAPSRGTEEQYERRREQESP